jgi:DNA-binding transcriptional ArsR family regulator
MVTNTFARRDVFQAIADPHRRAIISLLADKKRTLNEVADSFKISRPAISKHVKILTECGLIQIEQKGRERYCELKAEKLSEVADWVEQYRKIWEDRFDALELYLEELQAKDAAAKAAGLMEESSGKAASSKQTRRAKSSRAK